MINKFAERVTELLEKKGITKYKLAKDVGISKSVLSDYCSGSHSALWLKFNRRRT